MINLKITSFRVSFATGYIIPVVVVMQCAFDGWIDDLRFYVLCNSISVISGRCDVDNERLCAMEPRLRLRRFRLERGSICMKKIHAQLS